MATAPRNAGEKFVYDLISEQQLLPPISDATQEVPLAGRRPPRGPGIRGTRRLYARPRFFSRNKLSDHPYTRPGIVSRYGRPP